MSSILYSPKILFLVGNLIVVVLIGESKFFASASSLSGDIYYDEYSRSDQTRPDTMDLIIKFLNLVAPSFTFFSLFFFLPPFYLFKFFISILSSFFSENLAGKVVIITCASSGIGEHLAYEYGRRGARLALIAGREKSLQEVADRALDHVVNNAGITSVCMFEDAPPDMTSFRSVMDRDFWGSVYTTRFAVPHLRSSKGKIVVMSSAASWLNEPRTSVYNASKAALTAFFDTLRIEIWNDVKITIVTPGYIESEITKGKYLMKAGKMEVQQDMSDVQVSTIPVGSVSGCAKAIVNSACRGDRGSTPGSLSKKILDLTGARQVLHPPTIQSPEIKTY
ncbi:hypothetical protein CRYUN_Cryun12cG0177200 [Craigia yunnanensis]